MNVVIFASDSKGLSSLNSIIQEANNAGVNLWVMINQDTQLKHPKYNKKSYQIFTNCDNTDPIHSSTLGVQLPFKPDWLIINRERWEPESSIIMEFKTKFNSKIGLVEPNSHLLNNAETILEMYSRNRFVPYIDVFFDHSTHSLNQRKISGFKGNSVIVGNPKYDINLTPPPKSLEEIKTILPDKNIINFSNLEKTNEIGLHYVKDNKEEMIYDFLKDIYLLYHSSNFIGSYKSSITRLLFYIIDNKSKDNIFTK